MSYDAILIVSFGGPEGKEDILPFLKNVLQGRDVPRKRMREVAHHYELFKGVSPINSQNRLLVSALKKELKRRGPKMPVYLGNRNWHPFLVDTVARMAEEGIQKALALVTSPYSSYSSCRQYLENLIEAQQRVGSSAPQIDKVRAYYNHPGFLEPNAEHVVGALDQIPQQRRSAARIAFTAHSIPLTMAKYCRFEEQLQEACRLVSKRVGHEGWKLVYQSRSGRPGQPWLGPNIGDHLLELRNSGVSDVVISPIGFISDNMEVLYDLDIEARDLCQSVGLNMVRAETVGTHFRFIQMIRELILERTWVGQKRRYLGSQGASHDDCPGDCCPTSRLAVGGG